MRVSLKKAVLAIAASAAMIVSSFTVMNTVFPTTAQAASSNSLTLNASASSVEPGSTFTVNVGYSPSNTGAATAQFVLHYDSSKLELSNAQQGSSKFDYVTINTGVTGSVTVVAVYSMGGNVTSSGTISTMTFKAKNGASGSASISIDGVEMYDGTSYALVSSSAPGAISVNIAAATTTTTTTTTTTATTTTPKVTEQPTSTTTTPKVTEPPEVTTPVTDTTDDDPEETTVDENELPDEPDEGDEQTPIATDDNSAASAFVQHMQFVTVRKSQGMQFSNACMQIAYYLNGGGAGISD